MDEEPLRLRLPRPRFSSVVLSRAQRRAMVRRCDGSGLLISLALGQRRAGRTPLEEPPWLTRPTMSAGRLPRSFRRSILASFGSTAIQDALYPTVNIPADIAISLYDDGIVDLVVEKTPIFPGKGYATVHDENAGGLRYLVFTDPEKARETMAEYSMFWALMDRTMSLTDAIYGVAVDAVKTVNEIVDDGTDSAYQLLLSILPDTLRDWVERIHDNARKYALGATAVGAAGVLFGLKLGGVPGLIIVAVGVAIGMAGGYALLQNPKDDEKHADKESLDVAEAAL